MLQHQRLGKDGNSDYSGGSKGETNLRGMAKQPSAPFTLLMIFRGFFISFLFFIYDLKVFDVYKTVSLQRKLAKMYPRRYNTDKEYDS